MRSILFFLLISIFPISVSAQPQLDTYEDGVYRDYIRTVRLHVNGLFLSQPMALLGRDSSLQLTFDELDGRGTRYYYTVIHCDRNWNPTSELSQFDYLEGNREGEIQDYEFSSGTYQHYLHYKLSIPTDDLRWKISGNYILIVYEAGYEDDPIITRRFIVAEDKVSYRIEIGRTAQVAKQSTHQEIDFDMETEGIRTSNPREDFSCTIIQNGRWDNALHDITPRTITGSLLSYDYQDKIVFEAGKEFRMLDISSMKYRSENVRDVQEFRDGYSTILFSDEPRSYKSYIWRRDLNGQYVPFNRDYDHRNVPADSLASTIALVNRYNYREQHLATEYTDVHFTLELSEDFGKEIYVVGGMTDWKMLPEYKMQYDNRINAYTNRLILKQGYYNYQYAVPDARGNPDFAVLEGSWYATENQYTIITYFRTIGMLYDQVVGVHAFNSNER